MLKQRDVGSFEYEEVFHEKLKEAFHLIRQHWAARTIQLHLRLKTTILKDEFYFI